MKHTLPLLTALLIASLASNESAVAATLTVDATGHGPDVKLADPFGDDMVLQQGMVVPVWGVATPGIKVTVLFAGQSKTTTADAFGNWEVKLDPLTASSTNRELIVKGGTRALKVNNVLVGEVWICSGQSNMEMGVMVTSRTKAECDAEVAAAKYPEIRLRVCSRVTAPVPQTQVEAGPWRACSPQSVTYGTQKSGFSSVGYYFGRDLHRNLHVPVGLIQCAYSGTGIEPWTSAQGFQEVPELKEANKAIEIESANYRKALADYVAAVEAWTAAAKTNLANGTLPMPVKPPAMLYSSHIRQNTTLYNGMVAPWTRFAVRGVIWYQGEHNAYGDGLLYFDKLRALIGGWRKAWGKTDAEFPFYIVQLPPFDYESGPDALPNFWDAQAKAAARIPNVGMSHSLDLGSLRSIHPIPKNDVGQRLARLALSRTYGVKKQSGAPITDDTGPEFKSLEVKDSRMVVTFEHAKSGLASSDGKPLTHFEIAGNDSKFAPAQAEINGSSVILTSNQVSAPTHVRFGCSGLSRPKLKTDIEPPAANLINNDKLPASPFRTDTRQDGTPQP